MACGLKHVRVARALAWATAACLDNSTSTSVCRVLQHEKSPALARHTRGCSRTEAKMKERSSNRSFVLQWSSWGEGQISFRGRAAARQERMLPCYLFSKSLFVCALIPGEKSRNNTVQAGYDEPSGVKFLPDEAAMTLGHTSLGSISSRVKCLLVSILLHAAGRACMPC